jgi:tetratricopeptide (TPR) repeat protein
LDSKDLYLALTPDHPDSLRWLGVTNCTIDGDCKNGLEFLNRSIALKPTALAYSDRRNARRGLGDLDGAQIDCQKAVELDPGNYFGHLNLAAILFAKREFAGAASEPSLAGENARDPRWRCLRAETKLALKDFAGAAEDARTCLNVTPSDAAAWNLVSEAEEGRGDAAAAREAAAMAKKLGSGGPK